MQQKSEYFEARAWYEQTVTETGLYANLYSIDNWEANPVVVPDVYWSDMVVYMTETPSPYPRESVKVRVNQGKSVSYHRAKLRLYV